MLAFDFETYLIDSKEPAPKPVCVSSYDGKNELLISGANLEDYIEHVLKEPLIVAQNAKFETTVIYRWFPKLRSLLHKALLEERIVCTKINEQLLDGMRKKPLLSYSLADLVQAYFKVDISDSKTDPNAWRLRYSELDGVPQESWPPEAVDYAIQDSVWAYKIAEIQLQGLTGLDIHGPVRIEHNLALMGAYGCLIDQGRVNLLEYEVENLISHSKNVLREAKILELKTSKKKGEYETKNMNAFRNYLAMIVPNIEKTDSGKISTSYESLDRYAAQIESPIIAAYQNIAEYEKVLTYYVKRLKMADPYIRTEYKGIVRTGRTSSHTSGLYPSVNIQNMPRKVRGVSFDVRNCYIPRPGYKICSIDYSGLELLSAASRLSELTEHHTMLDIINSGTDPVDLHSMLGARVMSLQEKRKVTYGEFVDNKKKEPYATMRQISKAVDLGLPGGLGLKTMRGQLLKEGVRTEYAILHTSKFEQNIRNLMYKYQRELGDHPVADKLRVERIGRFEWALVKDDLLYIKKRFFDMCPEMEYFLSEGHKLYMTGETKPTRNEFGEWEKEPMYRYEIDGFVRDWCTYTEFCNGTLMQSPSAVGAKAAVNSVVERFFGSGHINPLAFIHDEIVFEVEDGPRTIELCREVAHIMIDSMQEVFNNVRVAVELDIMDYWKKSGGFYTETIWKDPKNGTKIN